MEEMEIWGKGGHGVKMDGIEKIPVMREMGMGILRKVGKVKGVGDMRGIWVRRNEWGIRG